MLWTRAERVFVVRRPTPEGMQNVSAYLDEYEAKFESQRWALDYKQDWDYVEGVLLTERLQDGSSEKAAAESVL